MIDEELHLAARAAPRSRRVLAVRMLVAKTAWLDGTPCWREGRVAWEAGKVSFYPGPADLARTQRSLHKVREQPVSARLALGDVNAWLEQRQRRLEVAKLLSRFRVPDLPRLTEPARRGSVDARRNLAALLTAEALCHNGLPISPAALLAQLGAVDVLGTTAADELLPTSVRLIAALALGAAGYHHSGKAGSGPTLEPYRRAFRWGLAHGLPEEPGVAGVVAALLAESGGDTLARRWRSTTRTCEPIQLLPGQFRELLEQVSPERAVRLSEALDGVRPSVGRLVEYRHLLPERLLRDRRSRAEDLDIRTRERRRALGELLVRYATSTHDPEALRAAGRLVERLLALGSTSPGLADTVLIVLRRGLELPVELRRPWLELLDVDRAHLWGCAESVEESAKALDARVQRAWAENGTCLFALLRKCGDPHVVRAALELDAHRFLAQMDWSDPERCHLAMRIVRQSKLPVRCLRRFFDLIDESATVAAARELLQPLVQVLARYPELNLEELCVAVSGQLAQKDRAQRPAAAKVLAQYLPRVLDLLKSAPHSLPVNAAYVILILHEVAPEQLETWIDPLLRQFKIKEGAAERLPGWKLKASLTLAVELAQGDLSVFLTAVRESLARLAARNEETLRKGALLLRRFPALRDPVAHAFARQPGRCLDLIVRLGETARLPAEVLSPLLELQDDTSHEHPLGDTWSQVVQLDPELEVRIREFRHARMLQGASAEAPAGVRRILEQPARLEQELAYLEELLARREDPEAALAARAQNLRERLDQRERLAHAMRDAMRDALAQHHVEALLAAAEHQVRSCFRMQLDNVVGPVPPNLAVDADWVNAALLSGSIGANRALLRRVLRARLQGDTTWPERHPLNQQFLRTAADRGLKVPVWLEERPARYPFPGVAGGHVHFRLERDPLRILQMGNYFNTCLSVNECNAFSTVVNACELNKRVLFVYAGDGRAVGRKLIGLNSDGALLGYHTYTALANDEEAGRLRELVRRYLGAFAHECGINLANEGTVPRILSPHWYDDGAEEWDAVVETGECAPHLCAHNTPSKSRAPFARMVEARDSPVLPASGCRR